MAFEWRLNNPVTRPFRVTTKLVSSEEVPGVDDDGEPTLITVNKETLREEEEGGLADRIRLWATANDPTARQFHIRLLYGRLNTLGEFEAAVRDDGIVIGGPEYEALDANQDGLISEDELLNMSAKILGWNGKLTELA